MILQLWQRILDRIFQDEHPTTTCQAGCQADRPEAANEEGHHSIVVGAKDVHVFKQSWDAREAMSTRVPDRSIVDSVALANQVLNGEHSTREKTLALAVIYMAKAIEERDARIEGFVLDHPDG
jgi:hypothetical protein